MEPITSVLGGVVVALVAGAVGKAIGDNSNVKKSICGERQMSCQNLITEKLDNLVEKVDVLTKAVNSKLFGI